MSYVDFASQAIARAQVAAEHDKNGEYEKARDGYTGAIETFLVAAKHEKNQTKKVMLRGKAKELMDRAEELGQYLSTKNNETKAHDDPTTPGATNKAKVKQDGERAALRESLREAIVQERPNIAWDDVAGLFEAKKALRQAVVLPLKLPHIFKGTRRAWKGILLYGPPGTGKTFLAKAVASQCNSTFFSISSSNLMSKWLGESERLVRNMFEMAREYSPSIIFIDEIDSLCSERSESGGGSDGATRVLTEFLAQMDGVGHDGGERVLVLGATNLPWKLDAAIRRRFEKRIYIPLPDEPARHKIVSMNASKYPNTLTQADWLEITKQTHGFSGSDISNLCRAALMQGVAKIEDATHFKRVRGPLPEEPETQGDLWEPCSPGDPIAKQMTLEEIPEDELCTVVPPVLTYQDFLFHIGGGKSVPEEMLGRFQKFTDEMGMQG
eukprot:TRINITY_DN67759_c5_g1_i1.p1 TRINITY_DN67759_c5_g1~~TRINITY_DN67759_c5_g1_i1.p1  ORF type:complete len:439 (+),score=53.45 TRINITY_DN67759_c5_g1_i1:40-1356(+)